MDEQFGHDAANGTRSALQESDWRYVETVATDDFTADDWSLLDDQRVPFYDDRQADDALRMLRAGAEDPTFGYQINNYRHCLQSATMAQRAGKDEEYVVVSLFHDIGFVAASLTHGAFAAALLEPYIEPENHWMLVHHAIFQNIHWGGHLTIDKNGRDKWRGHPAFERTAEFVALFDQAAMDPSYDNLPIEAFEPMVHRLFRKTPRDVTVE